MTGVDDGVILAVDGGGSKTDIVAIAPDGELLAHLRGPSSSPQVLGWPRALSVLESLRRSALEAVHGRRVLATHVYLSGLDLPVELAEAHDVLESWDAAVIDNDLFALLRAGTRSTDAVAVVCGTGINAIGVRADGATARFPAIGEISGDWGGGPFLGRKALWFAARADDGRGEPTLLTKTVPAALGLDSVWAVTEALHFGRLGPETFSRLCPVLFETSDAGDVVAQSVVDTQALEIVLLASAAINRLQLQDVRVPVVLGGGVLASQNERLLAGVTTGLVERAPHAEPVLVTSPPILGAGLAALETAGSDDDALERFRTMVLEQTWVAAGA
ncbi:MAG: N-acetylglucosamine kinase [Salinibacterium sp.]|nr:MAG: N-acetylglucosamine kinase [Salinibacterium sp.]